MALCSTRTHTHTHTHTHTQAVHDAEEHLEESKALAQKAKERMQQVWFVYVHVCLKAFNMALSRPHVYFSLQIRWLGCIENIARLFVQPSMSA